MEVRRAEQSDEDAILKLIGAEAFIVTKRFGSLEIGKQIEVSILSVVSLDSSGAVTGFACFNDRPCATVKDEGGWETWLPGRFNTAAFAATGMHSGNSVWLSCFASQHSSEQEVFYELVRFAFDVMPTAEQLLYLLPQAEAPFQPVQSNFVGVPAKEGGGGAGESLLMCPRTDFLPRCNVRRARVEDHDDLVPIFEAQSELLSEQYGEFFLADVIASSASGDSPQEALVAEIHGRAVGLIVVSSEVDVALLQDCFHVEPFGSLVKRAEAEEAAVGAGSQTTADPEDTAAAAAAVEAATEPEETALAAPTPEEEQPEGEPAAEGAALAEEEAGPATVEGAEQEAAGAEPAADLGGEAAAEPAAAELPGDAERALWRGVFDGMEVDADGRISFAELYAQVQETDAEACAKLTDMADEGLQVTWEELDERLLLALWKGQFDQLEANENGQVRYGDLLSSCNAISSVAFDATPAEEMDMDLLLAWEDFTAIHEQRLAAQQAVEEPSDAEQATEPPVAEGADAVSNCCGVIMYCMDERYSSRAVDFVEPIMSLFPDRDYCVLTQPYLSPEPSLLDNFVQVMPKPCSTFRDVLYVLHRSVTGTLTTRKATPEDAAAVATLVDGLPNADAVNTAFQGLGSMDAAAQKASKQQAYLMEYMGVLVGAAILKDGVDVAHLADSFQLEDHVALAAHAHDGHVMLQHFVLAPVFGGFVRATLHQLLRQSNRTVLYLQEGTGGSDEQALDLSVRRCMVQVKPRPPVLLPPADWSPPEDNWVDQQQVEVPDYALHFFSSRLVTERKECRNTRIVVVGASDTAKGFLEDLLLLSDVIFPHITMVVHGTNASGGGGVDGGLAKSHCFADGELARLALSGKVATLQDRLRDIDREGRMVVLDSNSLLGYDYLILATGLQESSLSSLGPAAEAIAGVWSLSNDQNIAAMEAAVPTASKVLIYGDTLQAYGALRRVISAGAAPTSVALVTPPKANGADTCFGDANIDALVKTQLTQLGVVLYDGNTEGCLASAVFESDGKAQEITCDVLGCFADPNTDLSVAKALNDNALVYDGRLVINALFQSNDPAVMAAGSVTKFSRRYGHQKPVRCYNSREVGIQLGRTVVDLAMFDGANLDADTLPTFSQAKAKGCVLPGPGAGLHFFSAAAPAGDKIRGAGTEGRALVTEATARDGSPQ
jgi:hypothetical protein